MKILALDIGAGTEDVLLFDNSKNIENCIKMVLPSPSQVFASEINNATQMDEPVFIEGDVIGGGTFSTALKKHLQRGLRVIMTEKVAYSIRNRLDEVRDLGIEIIKDKKELVSYRGRTLNIEEINILKLQKFLSYFGENLSDIDYVAIAVQDHGIHPNGMSNRKFRIQKMHELLKANRRLEALSFEKEEIPPGFKRMESAAVTTKRQLPEAKVLVMDTSPDAILGCLLDLEVIDTNLILAVNVGNGHTIAMILENGKVIGVMEHHTRLLDPHKIEQLLQKFADGTVCDEEIFEENGHGLFYLAKSPGFSKIEKVVATGPNRHILSKTTFPVHFAAPGGDVMMTGPLGLVEATKRKFKL